MLQQPKRRIRQQERFVSSSFFVFVVVTVTTSLMMMLISRQQQQQQQGIIIRSFSSMIVSAFIPRTTTIRGQHRIIPTTTTTTTTSFFSSSSSNNNNNRRKQDDDEKKNNNDTTSLHMNNKGGCSSSSDSSSRKRRRRPDYDILRSMSFIEQLQKDYGIHRNYRHGAFDNSEEYEQDDPTTRMMMSRRSSSSRTALRATTSTTSTSDIVGTSSEEEDRLTAQHQSISGGQRHEVEMAELPTIFPLEMSKARYGVTSDDGIVDELPPRMRFAPSPTGSLHVGGARTALYNWLIAKRGQQQQQIVDEQQRQRGGKKEHDDDDDPAFVLRVEDTDLARSTKESEESVLADLRWLGLHWDEGPKDTLNMHHQRQIRRQRNVGSSHRKKQQRYGPYRQSERNDLYLSAVQRLLQQGKAYRCFCTEDELNELKHQQEINGDVVGYDNRWRDADPKLIEQMLSKNHPYTIRFRIPENVRVVIDDVIRGIISWDIDSTLKGDFILLRSNGIPVYNFCVAIDDATMGITTVIRAEEHLTNTIRQILILDAIGASRPRYAHCSLILGKDKQKLSKRHGSTSCNQYRIDGYLSDAMINYLALLGWNDGSENEIYTRDELIECFDIRRINNSPSIFDIQKLNWINSQHIKMTSISTLVPLIKQQLQWQHIYHNANNNANNNMLDIDDTEFGDERHDSFAYAVTSLAKQMMETTKDAAINAKIVLNYHLPKTYNDLMNLAEKEKEKKESSSSSSETGITSDKSGSSSSSSDDDMNSYSDMLEMIQNGYFYSISMKMIEQYKANEFPKPDPMNPLEIFLQAEAEEAEQKEGNKQQQQQQQQQLQDDDDDESYTNQYKSHMKAIAKEMNVKGRNLFHPIRLALTGEMSGQDVTKQLSLLSLAETLNHPPKSSNSSSSEENINNEIIINEELIVSFDERMKRLEEFCNTIPEEYRTPNENAAQSSGGSSNKMKKKTKDAQNTSSSGATATTQAEAGDASILSYDGPPITALDIRVGRIQKVWEHEDADTLFCEEIDIGEDEPRMIASGLRHYMSTTDLEGKLVLVLCNLKERKMMGFPSHGMVLCASNDDHTNVKLVNPPIDAKVGERVTIPDFFQYEDDGVVESDDEKKKKNEPYAENKIAKKKIFEKISIHLKTNEYGIPQFCNKPFMTSAGICTTSIKNGNVS